MEEARSGHKALGRQNAWKLAREAGLVGETEGRLSHRKAGLFTSTPGLHGILMSLRAELYRVHEKGVSRE